MKTHTTKLTCAAVALLTLLTSGCAFVSLTDAGAAVRQSSAEDVTNCKLVATISSQTKNTVVVDRNLNKVREELIVLARNRAAEMGANAIVPVAEQRNGTQDFSAYSCP